METDTTEPGKTDTTAAASAARRRLYLIAMGIDSIGSGLWMPFGLIFFSRAQHIPLAEAGGALTLGGLIGLLAGPLGGSLVDRTGPALAVVVSNLLRTATFALYPLVGSAWQVAVLAIVTAAADRLFWTANTPLLASLVPDRMEGLLATQNVIRIIGLGAGAGLAGALAGTVSGLHAVAYLNAVSYVVAAAVLLAALGRPLLRGGEPPAEGAAQPEGDRPGWRPVLRDRPYLMMCVAQVLFALAASSLVVILPLASVTSLHGPPWLPSASIVGGNIVLALCQKPAVHWAKRHSRLRVLVLAGLVFAATFVLLAPVHGLSEPYVVTWVLVGSVTGVIGEVLSMPLMTAAANQAAPQELKGRYSALFQTSWGLATVAAPLIFTSLLDAGYAILWTVLAGAVLLTVPALLYAAPRLPAGCLRE